MTAPRRPPTGTQARAERTRTVVIDETVRCILDEGFAPPSVRHITDRAGVTWEWSNTTSATWMVC